ncbi:MAG: ABC transporter ATP-binding protein [Dehalococcoidia bacterium]|jgi:ABC-2 type transport system ATP-binding protein|nr:ABC transporter ATP-binding protein [Dehalococcoidia bacterium]MDP6783140.1 ABC transporter ATP-binding protein [Dehalococcoidia bacterium]
MAAQVGPAVEVRGVDFSYGGLRALDGLSLTVPRGVSFGLLGPNGAGKTTLIRMLVGLLRPWRGTVRILGEPSSPRTAASIGYMPQLPALYAELSVFHNVDFFARMYSLGNERPQRVEEVLRLVGLWERRRDSVLHLSGGMRQRLSLACALVHQPPLLLLDEPTVGLDPELRATFWEHFRGLTSAGTAIIISSHTMDDAAHCGELAFLRVGRVIAQGTPAQLRAATGREGATLEDAFLYFVRQG